MALVKDLIQIYYNMNEREKLILITYVNEHGIQITAKVTQANLDRLALKYEIYLIK